EEPVAGLVAEYFFDELIAMVARSQPITMAHQEFFMVEFKRSRLKINRDIKFLLKIILHPHIMVSYKELNGYAGIRDVSKFAEDAYISFWHNFPVLVPEIKKVAHNKDLCGICFYFIQEADDLFFPPQACFRIGGAKMKI